MISRDSESPGDAEKRPGEPEYQHSAPVAADDVEAALWQALEAWRKGDATQARKALLAALLGLG